MTKTIYALLVGINKYPSPIPELFGCVNDVAHMEHFLRHRVMGEGKDAYTLNCIVLTDAQARRQAVIDGFLQHLCKAGRGDIALFYYSGHGARELAPEAFWLLEPDHQNETIVCVDSRLPGNYDLADKELALLLQEVATQDEHGHSKAGTPHIVVMMDACHSGSGTRGREGERIRLAPADMRSRSLDSYIVTPKVAIELAKAAHDRGATASTGWYVPPRGRHVLLSACAAEETAKERHFGDTSEQRGVFSYYLLETLKRSGRSLTYYDLITHVRQHVINTVSLQTPQIEAVDPKDQSAMFLDGALLPYPTYFQINLSERDNQWVLAAGSMHGIQTPVGNETTRLALFPFEAPKTNASANPFVGRTIADAIGFADVTKVNAGQSYVKLEIKESVRPRSTYSAVVISHPLPPMQVAFEGDPALLDAVRRELLRATPGEDAALVVQEAIDPTKAELRLIASSEGYQIRRVSEYSWMVLAPDESVAIARLAHIARWQLLAGLENRVSQLPSDAVRMELHRVEIINGTVVETLATGSELRLAYRQVGNVWEAPKFKLTLYNTTSQTLYCAVLNLTETFGVFTAGLFSGTCVKLSPRGQLGSSVSAHYKGSPHIPAAIPAKLRQKQVDQLTDILKVIVSTDEINPALLEQADIQDIQFRTARKSGGIHAPKTTFGRLMRRVQLKAVGTAADIDEKISDWTTTEARIALHWPLETVAIPDEGKTEIVGGSLSVQGHAGLSAKAQLRLKPFGTADRHLSTVPPLLRSAPEHIQPMEFLTSRSAKPGHNAVELVLDNLTDYASVTRETPLVLHIGQPLAPNESIVMVSYDSERDLFIPVGFGYSKAGIAEIQVQTLPKPSSTGEKDLRGSLLMLVYKLIPEKIAEAIGFENPYPLLRVATVGTDGTAHYEERGEAFIRDRVSQAKRILLLVHGLIGDTRDMVAWVQDLHKYAPELPRYDLILTFDYENINTRIQDTAAELRERLEKVGLAENHGKTLDIVAHSLGTQICRWFVERERGNEIVSRLVMLGPPNAGTPLAVLQEWATSIICLGLNGLLMVANPAAMLVSLAGFVSTTLAGFEKIDTTLDQLKLNSEFYRDLNRSPDPRRPYYIVIGSTQRITYADQGASQPANPLTEIMGRIFSIRTGHRILSVAFAGQANDMAVSVKSAEAVTLLTPRRNPIPHVAVIDCDHISYFSNASGLQALAAALKDSLAH